MNVSWDRSAVTAGKFHAALKNGQKKKTEENPSPQQRMIDDFKEKHSNEANKTNAIFYKFRAGKKLTPEELEYLARESPQMYRQVREVMMERQAMEAQMEMAESKEEVAEIHVNQVNKIMTTMGTGEEAKRSAEKTMARANQTEAAYTEFTASLAYHELEDMESKTQEQRERLRGQKEQQEEIAEEIAQKADTSSAETETAENKASAETDGEEASWDDGKENIGKKRRKSSSLALPPGSEFFTASINEKEIQQKLRQLYRAKNKPAPEGAASARGIDVTL